MADRKQSPPSYVARRQPGLTATAARAQAVKDATKGRAREGDVYAAILCSEWRIAFEL
jgi:hypothetical protein